MSLKKAYLLIFIILLIDQISKLYIKTHFILGEEVEVFSWFKILFIENEGMAWGTQIPGSYGKIILTLFRLVAVTGIAYWLWDAVKKQSSNFLIVAIALIFAGAFGNIIDSVFYGKIYGYENWLHGRVVDMFYFPILRGHYPNWFPLFANEEFIFFRPVFNFADAAISVGVVCILIFQTTFLKEDDFFRKDA